MDGNMTAGSYARIRSLMDPLGRMGHTRAFTWKTNAPLDEKLIRLSVQVGRQIIDGDPKGLEDMIASTCDRYLAGSLHTGQGRIASRSMPSLPSYLSHLRVRGEVEGVVSMRGDGLKQPVDVLLTPDARLSTLMAKRASMDTLRLTMSGVRYGEPYWRPEAKWDMPLVEQIDPALLLGFPVVRDDLEQSVGVDVMHPPTPPRDGVPVMLDGVEIARSHVWLDVDGLRGRLSDRLDVLALDELGAQRQQTRLNDLSSGRIATAFTDKVPVSPKVASAARESGLHDLFDHVEFDEDIDLKVLPQLEREIHIAVGALPKASEPLDAFRVRKLGRYAGNTLGVYSPDYRTIVVDDGKATRNGFHGLSSFVHEYAHHLDAYLDPVMRLSDAGTFRPLFMEYCRGLEAMPQAANLSDRRRDYLMTPTEVFARGFELWTAQAKDTLSSCLAEPGHYGTALEYTSFDGVKDRLFSFYDATFPTFHGFDSLAKPMNMAVGEENAVQSSVAVSKGSREDSTRTAVGKEPARRVPFGEARFRIRLESGAYLDDHSTRMALISRSLSSVGTADGAMAGEVSDLSQAGRVMAVLAASTLRVRRLLPATCECVQTGRNVPAPLILPYIVDWQRELNGLASQGSPDPWEMKDRFNDMDVSRLPDLDVGAVR
jgi:hypothetical protein